MGDVWPWVAGLAASATVLISVTNRVADSPIIGWLGKILRWAGKRQYERENRETIELRKEVERLAERTTRMESKLDRQTVEIEDRDNYIVYVAEWARDVRIMIAALVPPLTIPDLKSFTEWRRRDK